MDKEEKYWTVRFSKKDLERIVSLDRWGGEDFIFPALKDMTSVVSEREGENIQRHLKSAFNQLIKKHQIK